MLINSLEFILFLIILVFIYKIIPSKFKWLVLLIASYIFILSNCGKYAIFMVLSKLTIYFT